MVQVAVADLAGLPVVNSVAVAQVQAVACAKPPDGVLYKPREPLRKYVVQGARIDTAGHGPDDLGAATWAVTSSAISMRATAVL